MLINTDEKIHLLSTIRKYLPHGKVLGVGTLTSLSGLSARQVRAGIKEYSRRQFIETNEHGDVIEVSEERKG